MFEIQDMSCMGSVFRGFLLYVIPASIHLRKPLGWTRTCVALAGRVSGDCYGTGRAIRGPEIAGNAISYRTSRFDALYPCHVRIFCSLAIKLDTKHGYF